MLVNGSGLPVRGGNVVPTRACAVRGYDPTAAGMTNRDTLAAVARSISVRLDDEADRALRPARTGRVESL